MAGGPFLQTFAQARTVEWGKKWQWDVQFPGDANSPALILPSAGFAGDTQINQGPYAGNGGGGAVGWFPATDVGMDLTQLEPHTFQGFGDTFDIPYASGNRTFSVHFADTDQHTVLTWLSTWTESLILSGGHGTLRLSQCIRPCNMAQLNNRGQVVIQRQLYVWPFGGISYEGSSDSTHLNYICSFRIAGFQFNASDPITQQSILKYPSQDTTNV